MLAKPENSNRKENLKCISKEKASLSAEVQVPKCMGRRALVGDHEYLNELSFWNKLENFKSKLRS